jgi:2-amino-4-hydroxy-6-hydroxymethyldihydropteridine diphosphokinase
MTIAYLGLGSNRGDRRAHLRAAVAGLGAEDSVRLTGCSPVYETEAHTVDPADEQPPFLNAVIEVEVTCSPERLLRIAQRLERREGRRRDEQARWTPRPLDVDLLVIGDRTCETEDLTLPHPRLAERRFVLRPWADLAPNFVVPPPFDATVRTLLRACPDTASIRRTTASLGSAPSSSESEPNASE